MKNVYLLIFILIFLYIICNGYIENFSVGCQSNSQGNDNKINISGSLTLPYIDKCKPICKENSDTKNYTYWVPPNTCTCPENTILQHSDNGELTRCAPPPPPPTPPCAKKYDDNNCEFTCIAPFCDCSDYYTKHNNTNYKCEFSNNTEPFVYCKRSNDTC